MPLNSRRRCSLTGIGRNLTTRFPVRKCSKIRRLSSSLRMRGSGLFTAKSSTKIPIILLNHTWFWILRSITT
ncbi:hypothetical protein DL95DRAFT_379261, partial [Leptodontidium sp. 2 PMI_412]